MTGPQDTTTFMPGDAGDRLERALAAASARGEHQSDEVCEAVEEVVADAKREGQPPERVVVLLKTLAFRALGTIRLPLDAVRAAIAWVVRCAVKAYYGRA
jgi:hypothetical protein